MPCPCGKRMVFGFPDDTKASCCNSCKKDGMIDIISKKCPCGKRMSFGFPDDSKASCCNSCKKDGMIDIINKKCPCGKNMSFGFPDDTKASCCNSCKKDGMIDIINKKCPCGKQMVFGFPDDSKASCCNSCKKDGMIDIKNKKCPCGKQMLFGFPNDTKPSCCSACKKDGMIDIKTSKCTICYNKYINRKFKKYCLCCYAKLHPLTKISRNYKTKEFAVCEFLKKHFPDFTIIHDKKTECSLYRPDFLIDYGSHCIIIEVDEDKHASYNSSCQNKRNMTIFNDLGNRPLIMIRFNPDKHNKTPSCWRDGKIIHQKDWDYRLSILKETVLKNLKKPSSDFKIEELFY